MTGNSAAKISILVPAYNAQRDLPACLASVLGQMAAHHELVVVDDGSQDATAAVVEEAQRQYPALAITLIRQPNQGLAATRDRLLAAAGGEYVLSLDADDLLLPGTLPALDQVIDAHAPDAIACDFNFWHPQNMRKTRLVQLGYPADTLLRDREQIVRTYLADRHNYVWAYVLRRALYAAQPQPLFPRGRAFEDVAVMPRMIAQCATLYRLARPTVDYRQSANSMKRGISTKWCRDFSSALREMGDFFRQYPASDTLRLQVDVTLCHFFICVIKESYQLGWREGQAARAEVMAMFRGTLLNDLDTVLAAMQEGRVFSHNPLSDAAVASQVRKAFSGSLAFSIGKTASRRIKFWQRKMAA